MNPDGATSGQRHELGDQPEPHDAAEQKAAAEERHTRADEQETALAAHEELSEVGGVLPTDRMTRAKGILADAHSRDDEADSRDSVADERDRAASLRSFLHDEEFDAGNRARRAAAMDRSDSKADRVSAAADRHELAEDDPGT